MTCFKKVCLLLVFIPITLYAMQQSDIVNAPANLKSQYQYIASSDSLLSDNGGVYNPLQSKDANASSSSFNFDSSMFSWKGPFTFNTTYSENYGVILKGQFTHMLGKRNAASLLVEGGGKTFRVNAGWGLLITQNQRVKLSVEHFMQKMNFNFSSGQNQQWIGQNAIGIAYQYLLHKGFLRAFHVNGFVSKANSKNLSVLDYIASDGFRYANFRRIAGGEEKNIGAGFVLLPTHWTEIDTNLSYQALTYTMHYQANTNNSEGLAYSLSLHQLLNKKFSLNLLYSHQQSQEVIGSGFEILLPSPHATALDLKFNLQHLKGRNGLSDDNQVTAGIDFRWGVDGNTAWSITPSGELGDLASWLAQPAVLMNQVLALVDQKSVLIGPSLTALTSSQKKLLGKEQGKNNIILKIPVDESKAVDVDLKKYLSSYMNANQLKHVSVSGLPHSLTFHAGSERLTGQWPRENKGKQRQAASVIPISIVAVKGANHLLSQQAQSTPLLKAQLVGDTYWLFPNNAGPKSLTLHEGQTFSKTMQIDYPEKNASSLFINYFANTHVNVIQSVIFNNLPSSSGIRCDQLNQSSRTITCHGIPRAGQYNSTITLSVLYNNVPYSSTLPHFLFNVIPQAKPPAYNGKKPLPQLHEAGKPLSPIDFSAYFSNPPSSGQLALNAADKNVLGVEYQAPGADTFSSKVDLYHSALGTSSGIVVAGSPATQLHGDIPLSAAAGVYKILVRMENTKGLIASDGPSWLIYVLGAPEIKPGISPPGEQLLGPGQAIHDIHFSDYYNNPQKSGDLSISNNDLSQLSVSYTPDGGKPQVATTLAESNLKSLTLDHATLSGRIPSSAPAGNYSFSVHSANAIGLAKKALVFKLIVGGSPTFNGHNQPQSDYLPGDTISHLDFNSSFVNPSHSGDMYLNKNDQQSIAVNYRALSGKLQASTDFAHSAFAKGVGVSGLIFSGKLSPNIAAGTYGITVRPKNNYGASVHTAYAFIIIKGAPVINPDKVLPSDQTVTVGNEIKTIDYKTYYYNAPDSGNEKLDSHNVNILSVAYTPDGGSQQPASSLADSHLKALQLDNGVLSGTIGNDVPAGQYVITAHLANDVGISKDAVKFILNVQCKPAPPIYKGGGPQSQAIIPGSKSGIGFVDFKSYFTNPPNSGVEKLVADDARVIGVEYEAPGSSHFGGKKPLVDSSIGDSKNGLIIVGMDETTLAGRIPANVPPGVYKLLVRMMNTSGLIASRGPDWLLYVEGVPQIKPGVQPPPTQVVAPGREIQTVSMRNYYINPQRSGNLSLNANDIAQISVTYISNKGQSETVTDLADSNLKTLTTTNGALSGYLPDGKDIRGSYDIDIHSANNVGPAKQEIKFRILVA